MSTIAVTLDPAQIRKIIACREHHRRGCLQSGDRASADGLSTP
jgi:hypothetical protein